MYFFKHNNCSNTSKLRIDEDFQSLIMVPENKQNHHLLIRRHQVSGKYLMVLLVNLFCMPLVRFQADFFNITEYVVIGSTLNCVQSIILLIMLGPLIDWGIVGLFVKSMTTIIYFVNITIFGMCITAYRIIHFDQNKILFTCLNIPPNLMFLLIYLLDSITSISSKIKMCAYLSQSINLYLFMGLFYYRHDDVTINIIEALDIRTLIYNNSFWTGTLCLRNPILLFRNSKTMVALSNNLLIIDEVELEAFLINGQFNLAD
jgi:hypothetical protein